MFVDLTCIRPGLYLMLSPDALMYGCCCRPTSPVTRLAAERNCTTLNMMLLAIQGMGICSLWRQGSAPI